jgi:predicted phosphodiesterase
VYPGIVAAVWTRDHLSSEAKEFLQSLPMWIEAAPGVVVCHGDLESADTYVSTDAGARRALEQLDRLRPGARILVCGHTHHAALFAERMGFISCARVTDFRLPRRETCLLNPGAVGQARDDRPLARYAVVDLERGIVSYAALEYDHATTVRKLRQRRLVARVVLPPSHGVAGRIEHWKMRAARRWASWWTRSGSGGEASWNG